MVNEDEDEVVDEGLPTEVGQLIDGNGGLDRSEGEEGDGVEGEDGGGGGRKQGGGGGRMGGEQWETGESRRLSKGGGNGGVGRRADLLGG